MNCRLVRAVVVPAAIPPQRLDRYGARGKVRSYEGLKEEYYLADFEPDRAVLQELGLDESEPIVVVRTPPAVSLNRFENPLFARVLDRLAGEAQTVVLPRTPSQREEITARPGMIVPERAIDAQSLIAFSDLVISAGGTMTVSRWRWARRCSPPSGAVDEGLLREGRLRRLTHPDEIRVEKRAAHGGDRIRRDPAELATLLLSAREQ